MPKIVRCELTEIISNLEAISHLNVRELGAAPPEDLFICALGFEPRCLALPSRLNDAGYQAKRAYYFKYTTNPEDNAANLSELDRHLSGIASTVEPIEADVRDFPIRLRTLLELVISEAEVDPPRITMDISVAANRLLLRCVKVLLEYKIRLRIIYSEAAIYRPTKEEYEKNAARWTEEEDLLGLERGVGDVMLSVDHPGDDLDPLPDSLILFPNLKGDRSKAVISSVDPSLLQNPSGKVIWLPGIPHLEQDQWRLEAVKKINGIGIDTQYFEVSTFDYKDTLQRLENLYTKLSEESRITISPLGSKMQALGTALFCYMHHDVRVILSSPREYNAAQYSEGCKEMWKINFGSLEELRYNLDQVGTLHIED